MSRKLLQALPELLEARVIDAETAQKIRLYYQRREEDAPSRLFIVFGVLGALLISLGIILILAHNWDQLSRFTKSIIAFIPLLIGQVAVAYTLWKKPQSAAWRESSATFLIFAVGAAMALISQIYNIPGKIESFMLTWILLSLPLVYILRSSFASLLCLAGITYYGGELGYAYPRTISLIPWLLLLVLVPHYYFLYRDRIKSNFFTFHNWFFPIALVILLGTFGKERGELLVLAYIALFGLFYQLGNSPELRSLSLFRNGWIVAGSLGTIILMLFLSSKVLLEEICNDPIDFSKPVILWGILTVLAGALLFRNFQARGTERFPFIGWVFLLMIPLYILGQFAPGTVAVLVNIILLFIGISYIQRGGDKNSLGLLNYGLLIITALIIARFFDTNISFVLRGILFVLVGAGFFAANYWLLQKRKNQSIQA